MEGIVWSDDLSVEIPILDKHHKTIIGLLNELIEFPELEVTSERFHHILHELMDYTVYHLRYEEELMDKSNYPELMLEEHAKEHDEFIERIIEFTFEATDRVLETPTELLLYLKSWFEKHILITDKKYAKHLKEYLYS